VPLLDNIGLAELIVTRGWYIWWERRIFVHGTLVQNSNRSTMSIAALTCNYMRSRNRKFKVREGWKKPTEGKLMVNIGSDYQILKEDFVAASMNFLPLVLDAHMVEAYALKGRFALDTTHWLYKFHCAVRLS
jgi:hypothetical protein